MSMSLSKELLGNHVNRVFVETGTNDGRGVLLALSLGFREVHSIEIDDIRYREAMKAVGGLEGVVLYHGDTVEILPNVVENIKERTTIWLDAHPIGEGDNCKKGRVRHPLTLELELIAQHSFRKDHTILVDDRHEFPLYPTTDAEVCALIRKINPAYKTYIDGDKIVGVVR